MSSKDTENDDDVIDNDEQNDDSEIDESDDGEDSTDDDCSEDDECSNLDEGEDNDDVNWEGLLHFWERKIKTKVEMLSFANIPVMSLDDSEDDLDDEDEPTPAKSPKLEKIKCVDMMLPEFSSSKNKGFNMIKGDQLVDVVRRKSGDKLDLKVLLLDSVNEVDSLSFINLWPSCPKLTVLSLRECKVESNAVIALAKHISNLKVLDLHFVKGIDDSALVEVAKNNKNLGWVSLSGINLGQNGLKNFLSHCGKSLQVLYLTEHYVDSAAINCIAQYCKGKKLKSLNGGGPSVAFSTDSQKVISCDAIKNLIKCCPNITFENFDANLLREADCKDGYKHIVCDKEMKILLRDIVNGPFGVHIEEIQDADEEVIDLLYDSVAVNTLKNLSLPIEMRCISEEAFRKLKVFKNLEHLGCGFALGEFDGLEGPSVSNDAILEVTNAMCLLKSIDFTFSPILPDTIQTVIQNHPSLEKLTLDGCGGELYDYTDFLMKLSEIEELDLIEWTSKNKYGERSGIYRLEAKEKLIEMGLQLNVS